MGFRPGDSTTKQLLYIVNEIHQAFERPKSFVKPIPIPKSYSNYSIVDSGVRKGSVLFLIFINDLEI